MSPYILDTQTYCKERGYDPGPLDGLWGPKTESAYNKMVKEREIKRVSVATHQHFPSDSIPSLTKFYGTPEQAGNQLALIKVPWLMYYEGKPVKAISIHQNVAIYVTLIFQEIWNKANLNQAQINKWGLNIYDGSYNNRPIAGSKRKSVHAFGGAMDIDADHNADSKAHGNRQLAHMSEYVIEVFANHGFLCLGSRFDRDFMHLQGTL